MYGAIPAGRGRDGAASRAESGSVTIGMESGGANESEAMAGWAGAKLREWERGLVGLRR